MSEAEIVAAIKERRERLHKVEQLPEGTELPCYFGPRPHPEFCVCNGTGTLTREVVIDDLLCDLEILHK